MDGWVWLVAMPGVGLLAMVVRYAPTRPGKSGEQETRNRMTQFLRQRPMSSQKAIQQHLDLVPGTTAHHLRVLEDSEIISSLNFGHHRRYYLPGLEEDMIKSIGLLRDAQIRELTEWITKHPGDPQEKLTLNLKTSRKVIRSRLDRMIESNLIQEENKGRHLEYYPTPLLQDALKTLQKEDEGQGKEKRENNKPDPKTRPPGSKVSKVSNPSKTESRQGEGE